jgi:hypothetical protein
MRQRARKPGVSAEMQMPYHEGTKAQRITKRDLFAGFVILCAFVSS